MKVVNAIAEILKRENIKYIIVKLPAISYYFFIYVVIQFKSN